MTFIGEPRFPLAGGRGFKYPQLDFPGLPHYLVHVEPQYFLPFLRRCSLVQLLKSRQSPLE